MTVVIYALADEIGQPLYVGQTTKSLSLRLSQHRSTGIASDGDSIVPLEISPEDPDEAERRWIAQLRAGGWVLRNRELGGRRGARGITHTVEARARISEAHRGKSLSVEHRAKLSAAHKGVPLSPEHRAAIGRGGSGLKRSDESRTRLSAAKTGELNPMSRANRERRAQGGDAL